jgi:hypothetical protein
MIKLLHIVNIELINKYAIKRFQNSPSSYITIYLIMT